MFDPRVYVERRAALGPHLSSGLALFLGHGESAMNYPDNPYPFRQDSTFL